MSDEQNETNEGIIEHDFDDNDVKSLLEKLEKDRAEDRAQIKDLTDQIGKITKKHNEEMKRLRLKIQENAKPGTEDEDLDEKPKTTPKKSEAPDVQARAKELRKYFIMNYGKPDDTTTMKIENMVFKSLEDPDWFENAVQSIDEFIEKNKLDQANKRKTKPEPKKVVEVDEDEDDEIEEEDEDVTPEPYQPRGKVYPQSPAMPAVDRNQGVGVTKLNREQILEKMKEAEESGNKGEALKMFNLLRDYNIQHPS